MPTEPLGEHRANGSPSLSPAARDFFSPPPGSPEGSFVLVELVKTSYVQELWKEFPSLNALFNLKRAKIAKNLKPADTMGTRGVHIQIPDAATSRYLLVTSKPKNHSNLISGYGGLGHSLQNADVQSLQRRPKFKRYVDTSMHATIARLEAKSDRTAGLVQGRITDIKFYPLIPSLYQQLAPTDGNMAVEGIVPHVEPFVRFFKATAIVVLTVTPLRKADGGHIEHDINEGQKSGFFRLCDRASEWLDEVDAATRRLAPVPSAVRLPTATTIPALWNTPRPDGDGAFYYCNDFRDVSCAFHAPTVELLRSHWMSNMDHAPTSLSSVEFKAFANDDHVHHETTCEWFEQYARRLYDRIESS